MLTVSVKWREVEIDIDGDIVSAEMRPLRRGDVLAIMPVMADEGKDNATRTLEAFGILGSSADQYIRNLKGVEVDGSPVDVNMLFEESVLLNIAGAMLMKLVEISGLGGKAGNSEGQSVTPA